MDHLAPFNTPPNWPNPITSSGNPDAPILLSGTSMTRSCVTKIQYLVYNGQVPVYVYSHSGAWGNTVVENIRNNLHGREQSADLVVAEMGANELKAIWQSWSIPKPHIDSVRDQLAPHLTELRNVVQEYEPKQVKSRRVMEYWFSILQWVGR